MVRSIYEMPVVRDTVKGYQRTRPKYDSILAGFNRTTWTYGDEPHCLVGVQDITPAADSSLTSNADVFKAPDNLDTVVGTVNTRNQLRTRLEQDEFPGTWIQVTTTYREIARIIGACCQFAQRYMSLLLGPWFSGTVHVSSNFSSLTAQQQQGFKTTATSFGFDQTIIQPANTIRDILKNMADQYIAAGLPLDLDGPI